MPPSKRIRYCPVPGCGLRTNSFRSQYCQRHARLYREYGHPEGDQLMLHELKPYLRTTGQIIRDNLDHPDIQHVLGWIQRFLDQGEYMLSQDAKTTGQDTRRWLGILQAEEITPQAILEMILAAGFMFHQRPHRFKDIRHYRHTVIHRVLKLARGYQKGSIRPATRELLSLRLLNPLFDYCRTLARLHYREWEDTDLTMLEKAKSYNGFDFLPTANNLPS